MENDIVTAQNLRQRTAGVPGGRIKSVCFRLRPNSTSEQSIPNDSTPWIALQSSDRTTMRPDLRQQTMSPAFIFCAPQTISSGSPFESYPAKTEAIGLRMRLTLQDLCGHYFLKTSVLSDYLFDLQTPWSKLCKSLRSILARAAVMIRLPRSTDPKASSTKYALKLLQKQYLREHESESEFHAAALRCATPSERKTRGPSLR